jgi:hypothetical protein
MRIDLKGVLPEAPQRAAHVATSTSPEESSSDRAANCIGPFMSSFTHSTSMLYIGIEQVNVMSPNRHD